MFFLFLLAGCSKGPSSDLQYIKQARSLAAEWALVNEQANSGRVTGTYVSSMHYWLNDGLRTAYSSLAQPHSAYGQEIASLLAEAPDTTPQQLRAHSETLKQTEDDVESA
jgi:hypothetical protein